MNRRVEVGATLAVVAVFTGLIVFNGLPSAPVEAPAATAAVERPPEQRPQPTEEVRSAPRLTEVWREDFENLDGWRLERGNPATIAGGIVTLHDAPSLPPLYAQTQPFRFQAADLLISARSPEGGYIDIGLARAVAGRDSELVAPGYMPVVRDGLELRLVWHEAGEARGWGRWKRDGHHWISLPIQDGAFPANEFTTVTAEIRQDSCSVSVDGELRAEYSVPRDALRWPDAPYRIYLGASSGDPQIDFIELRPVELTTVAPQEGTT